MSLEFYLQYGVPTLFLVLGLFVFAVARFQATARSARVACRRDQGRPDLSQTVARACRPSGQCGLDTLLDPPGRRS